MNIYEIYKYIMKFKFIIPVIDQLIVDMKY